MVGKRTIEELDQRIQALVGQALLPDETPIPEILDLFVALSYIKEDTEHATEALEAVLLDIGDAAIPHLVRETQNPAQRVRATALYLLSVVGKPGNREIVDVAKKALVDGKGRVRESGLLALAVASDEDDLPILTSTLEDSGFHLYSVVAALGRIGSPSAIAGLEKLIYLDDRTGIIPYVIEALESIGTEDAIRVVQDWKQSEAGRLYIERSGFFRLQALELQPAINWNLSIPDRNKPYYELLHLQMLITLDALSRALRISSLSDSALALLSKYDNLPEAQEILRNWKQE